MIAVNKLTNLAGLIDKKYKLVVINRMQAGFAYRFNVFASVFSELFSLTILSYLWFSIYNQGNQIGSYSIGGLIIYYAMTKFISLTIHFQDVARGVGDAIRDGDINEYLLKPVNYMGTVFSYNLGGLIFNLVLFTIIYFFIFLGLALFSPQLINIQLNNIIYFSLFFILAFLINFLIFYIIGILTFYLGFIMGFNYIISSISGFLSGKLIPLDLFPAQLLIINNYLPFKFITYIPISIITGRLDLLPNLWLLFAQGLVWVLILYFLAITLYNNGLKKYESFSG